jgi:hypothetical protein
LIINNDVFYFFYALYLFYSPSPSSFYQFE